MGHPEPFNLKYLGVGNEQWGEDYFARYRIFQAALKAKHPEIQLVTAAGPGVDDGFWKLAWDKFRSGTPADIVDEHYYRPPQWFLENATRYDAQDRARPEGLRGRIRRARRATAATTLRAAHRGGGVHDRPRAQQRPRRHVVLRAAFRQGRRVRSGRPTSSGSTTPASTARRRITCRRSSAATGPTWCCR